MMLYRKASGYLTELINLVTSHGIWYLISGLWFLTIYLTVVVDGEVVGDSRRPTAVVWPLLVTGVGVPVSELKAL